MNQSFDVKTLRVDLATPRHHHTDNPMFLSFLQAFKLQLSGSEITVTSERQVLNPNGKPDKENGGHYTGRPRATDLHPTIPVEGFRLAQALIAELAIVQERFYIKHVEEEKKERKWINEFGEWRFEVTKNRPSATGSSKYR